ncbi:thioredoxin family protein [Halobacteriales archaeon QS_4_70_19]|nr:MAG: thioredoxin family protein [Halobacteriales archaeon QS_4_70_19]
MVSMESEADALERGDAAPAFELPGTDGGTYTLDSFTDNEALLLVFTCNHCPYAEAKFDALNGIAADYDDVAVVGVNPNDAEEYPEDSFEAMQECVESGQVQYDAYLRDESQEVAAAYGATCTPDPFLFARSEAPRASDGDAAAPRSEWHLKYHGRLDDAMTPDEEPSGEPGFEMRELIDTVLAGETVEAEMRPSRGCSIKWRD